MALLYRYSVLCVLTAFARTEPDESGQRGVIINIASMAGLFPQAASPVYCASKYGVVGFSRSLEGLAGDGIRVNAICPTYTDTPLLVRRGHVRMRADLTLHTARGHGGV